RIEQDHHVLLVLDQALGLLDHHLRDLHVARGRLVESRRDDLALHGALHLGDLLGPLVDQQHDQVHLGVIPGDRSRDVLQQHRLAGLRRRNDQAALALADRRDEVDDARGEVLGRAVAALELQPLGRMQRRQILEQHLVARVLGRIEIDLADLQQREIALAFLRRTNQAGDRVAGTQIEAANLTRADVDVVRTGEIGAVGRAQEAEAVLQDLEHAVAVDVLALLGVRIEDREDDVLLARAREALEADGFGHLHQLVDRLRLELGEAHRSPRLGQFLGADDLGIVDLERLEVTHLVVAAYAAVAVTVAVAPAAAAAALLALPAATAAPLVTEIASHRLLSRKAASCDLDTAPTFWASTAPFLNRISVGMPRMPNFGGVCGFSSILSFAIRTLSLYSSASSSR